MNFNQLEIFQKTAETENMSKAAKELFIAQPTLSRVIKELEIELGYPLFDRNGKQITLNKNGEILYKHVKHLQYDFSQMRNELLEANEKTSSFINVSFRVASKILPDILELFYKKNPNITLKVYQVNQVTKSLPEFDVVIDSDLAISAPHKDDVLLLEEPVLLALPKDHPLLKKEKIVLSDLKGQPCCLLNEFSSLGKMIRSELTQKKFTPDIIFESDNPFMIRDFLKLNLSYSFVPSKTWSITKDFPDIKLRELDDFNCSRNIFLSYGKNKYISLATKEFVRHVKEYFKSI